VDGKNIEYNIIIIIVNNHYKMPPVNLKRKYIQIDSMGDAEKIPKKTSY